MSEQVEQMEARQRRVARRITIEVWQEAERELAFKVLASMQMGQYEYMRSALGAMLRSRARWEAAWRWEPEPAWVRQ